MNGIITIELFEHFERIFMWYYMYPDTDEINELPYFIHSIGLHELQPHISKPNGDMNDQFFYNSTGNGVLILNGHKINIPAGYGFFIKAGTPHEYYPTGSVWDVRWMVPRGNGLPLLYKKLGLKEGVYSLRSIAELEIQLNIMREELLNDPIYGTLYASSHVQAFIIEFARQARLLDTKKEKTNTNTSHTISTYTRHMNTIADFVDHQFMNHISEKDLCTIMNITPQHLCRITRECAGMSPTEYINYIRIKKAKEYLCNTNYNACEIAKRCGYENNNYFWRNFKKLTGLAPGEFRRKYGIKI